MKLWEKELKTDEAVMRFTVGNDSLYDKRLAPYDIVGSMAHAIMLGETGLLSLDEAKTLVNALSGYYPETRKGDFSLNPGDEDIHSHLENYLVDKAGNVGKKIHTARSRNDQVLFALQLMMKEEWRLIFKETDSLFRILVCQAEKFHNILIPGYTHTQVAMPSSFGIWLGAFAEALVSDLKFAEGIISVTDQNPLGSAAGFGSSFPVDRDLVTRLSGFSDLLISPVSAQLSRGKLEGMMAAGLGSIAATLSRLAADAILFMSQNMDFITFPDNLTTGSSIMPHKKNPDVLELIRAHCNVIGNMPTLLNGLTANLISGYHRDFQLTKEILFPGIDQLKQCLTMMSLMISNMTPKEGILDDEKYKYIFSVEEVNKKVMEGKSFRDAYREVAGDIENGSYSPGRSTNYTHVGSIGNPELGRIKLKMDGILKSIQIKPIDEIFESLSNYY